MGVQGVKDLENVSVYTQKVNLRNLRTQQSQRSSDVTSLMSFCSLRLWVLTIYWGLISLKNLQGEEMENFGLTAFLLLHIFGCLCASILSISFELLIAYSK